MMKMMLVAAFVFVAEPCKHETSKTGFKLDVNAILTLAESDLLGCYTACIDNKFCQSFNLDFRTWTCHLLNVSFQVHPEKLIPAMDWMHMTNPLHTCYSDYCNGGGTCTGPSDNVSCICDIYHQGERCQHKGEKDTIKVDEFRCLFIQNVFYTFTLFVL